MPYSQRKKQLRNLFTGKLMIPENPMKKIGRGTRFKTLSPSAPLGRG